MRTTTMPMASCLVCNALLDAATGVGDTTPSEGDITVCAECGHLMQWSKGMKLVEAGVDVVRRIDPELLPRIRAMSKMCSDRFMEKNGFRASTVYEEI